MSIKNWIKQNTENLEGKKVAVSGSTGGIGRELCKILVGLGADLVCLDRNAQKVADLQKTLLKERPNLSLCHVPLDLENVDSVRTAAEALKEIKPDVLILNAGAYHIPRKKSALGLENVFQINFLSPYFLVRELMDLGVKVVADKDGGEWIYFDYVPGEPSVRRGKADVTGKLCVIGSKIEEEKLGELFGV